jgi:acyl carrier protein
MADMDPERIGSALKAFIRDTVIKDRDYPLRDDEPLFSSGLTDSFSLAHIAAFIEREIGVRIPDTELTLQTMDSIASMRSYILNEMKKMPREER